MESCLRRLLESCRSDFLDCNRGSSLPVHAPNLKTRKGKTMKYAGLLVMPAGFFLALAALVAVS